MHYHNGHEAHFTQVTEHFLKYLSAGKLPEWEVPNMLTKYATIMQAYELIALNRCYSCTAAEPRVARRFAPVQVVMSESWFCAKYRSHFLHGTCRLGS